jgi:hypothetical protein
MVAAARLERAGRKTVEVRLLSPVLFFLILVYNF